MGKVATSPLPSQGSPPLRSGGQNQKWPTCGQSGYVSPCRLGDPHRCRARGQNQKWPTCGQSGYVTPAVSGIPTAAERGKEIRSGPLMGNMATSPLPSRGSQPLRRRGAKSEVAHLWARWLRHPCRLGDSHRFRAGGKIRSGPLMGKVATSPLPSRGSPPLQGGGQNQKWPTCGQGGYVTTTVSGIPTAAERGAKSEVAHLWAKWLCHPCRLGDPHRFRAGGGGIRSGPLMGKVATSPLPSPGSPPLQSGGQNQKWPTYGRSGYVTPAISGIPTASGRGTKSEVAHLWARWLRHPYRLGDPQRCRAGGKSQVAHLWATWLRHPCRLGDPHRFRAGGQNQKWPSCRQSGYATPSVSGIPTAAEPGGGGGIGSGPLMGKVATSPLPSQGSPPLQSGGGGIRSGPLMGKVATSPLPSRGSPPLQSEGVKIRSGPLVGNVATSPLPSRGSPPLQSGGAKSEVAQL